MFILKIMYIYIPLGRKIDLFKYLLEENVILYEEQKGGIFPFQTFYREGGFFYFNF